MWAATFAIYDTYVLFHFTSVVGCAGVAAAWVANIKYRKYKILIGSSMLKPIEDEALGPWFSSVHEYRATSLSGLLTLHLTRGLAIFTLKE